MNSLSDKMKVLPSIEIDANDEFVLKIKHNGIIMSELLISVKNMNFQFGSGKSEVYLYVENPKSIEGVSLLIETGEEINNAKYIQYRNNS